MGAARRRVSGNNVQVDVENKSHLIRYRASDEAIPLDLSGGWVKKRIIDEVWGGRVDSSSRIDVDRGGKE